MTEVDQNTRRTVTTSSDPSILDLGQPPYEPLRIAAPIAVTHAVFKKTMFQNHETREVFMQASRRTGTASPGGPRVDTCDAR
ncbi:MAG: hypothetical protein WBC37_11545 [Burkholderiaceae bacterium]